MKPVAVDARQWIPAPQEGVEICVLQSHDEVREVAALLRMQAGAKLPRHDHPGGEHLYVIRGRVEVDEQVVRAGDYHCTPIGERHEVVAREECLLFSVLPGSSGERSADA